MAIRPDFIGVTASDRLPFIGRWRELDIFEGALWRRQAAEEHRVLVFHGVGGVGKTRLLERLRDRMDEPDVAGVPRAVIDFELQAQRDAVSGLVHLRNEWRRSGVATFAFDAAFARHFALSTPGRNIRSDYPELFGHENDMLAELVGLAGEAFRSVPGLDLVTRVATRLGGSVLDWVRGRGHPLMRRLDGLAPQELMVELPMFLGHDLAGYAEKHASTRPVCFVDTYEAVWRDFGSTHGQGVSTPDRWLRKLVTNQPGTLFVIFGRRQIDWELVDPDWAEVVENVSLDALAPLEQSTLLDRRGIAVGPVRSRMMETAQGHPLMLTTQVRLHERLVANGHSPMPEDFPVSHKEVLDRFFSHLDVGTRAIMRALAYPAVIDAPLWAHLARSGFSAFDAHSPRDVLGDVFFREVDVDRFVMHEVVRDHLLADLDQNDSTFARRARLAAFRYFDLASGSAAEDRGEVPDIGGSSVPRDAALLDAAELLAAAQPGSFADWCLARFRGDLKDRGSRHRLLLLERATALATGSPAQQFGLAALEIRTNPFDRRAVERLITALEANGTSWDVEDAALLADTVIHLTQGERQLDPRLPSLLRHRLDQHPAASLRIAISGRDREEISTAARRFIEGSSADWSVPNWNLFVAAALTGDFEIARAAVKEPANAVGPEIDPDTSGAKLHKACIIAHFCIVAFRESWAIPLICESIECGDETALFEFATGARSGSDLLFAALLGAVLDRLERQSDAEALLALVERSVDIGLVETALGVRHPALEDASALGASASPDNSLAKAAVEALRREAMAGDPQQMLARTKVELLVNDRGEFVVLYDHPLLSSTSSILFSNDESELYFLSMGTLLSFGIPIHPKLKQHMVQGTRGLLICMDEATGDHLGGGYRPSYSVPGSCWEVAVASIRDAWLGLRTALADARDPSGKV